MEALMETGDGAIGELCFGGGQNGKSRRLPARLYRRQSAGVSRSQRAMPRLIRARWTHLDWNASIFFHGRFVLPIQRR